MPCDASVKIANWFVGPLVKRLCCYWIETVLVQQVTILCHFPWPLPTGGREVKIDMNYVNFTQCSSAVQTVRLWGVWKFCGFLDTISRNRSLFLQDCRIVELQNCRNEQQHTPEHKYIFQVTFCYLLIACPCPALLTALTRKSYEASSLMPVNVNVLSFTLSYFVHFPSFSLTCQ